MQAEQRTIHGALEAAAAGFPNVQRRPPTVDITDLVAKLAEAGMTPCYRLQHCQAPPTVRFLAILGPLELPLDFEPGQARALSASLALAADIAEGIDRRPEDALAAAMMTSVVDA